MTKKNIFNYFHSDKADGLNDCDACVAFVRGILENAEDKMTWELTRKYVMMNNLLLSQLFINHLGILRDGRGLSILKEKLAILKKTDRTIECNLFAGGQPIELLCLKAVAGIGGNAANDIIKKYYINKNKKYLAREILNLKVSSSPSKCNMHYGADFPKILKGIRSVHDVVGLGGVTSNIGHNQANEILKTWRKQEFRGKIEYFSGDGETTIFQPKNKIVEYIHDVLDPFSDFGIFNSNPKLEYPVGKRRFADSHTYIGFHIADGSLYDKEYTWDCNCNTIKTYFHHYVFEETTVNPDGISVNISHKPISTGVEVRGNVFSKQCSSAVRGVWTNPYKQGINYYIKRANILTQYKRIYYFAPLHTPVVNLLGVWAVDEKEKPERFFDGKGNCVNINGVIDELLIPLHHPKILAGSLVPYKATSTDHFSRRLVPKMREELTAVPACSLMNNSIGAFFEHSRCGNAGIYQNNLNGYIKELDINADGIINETDRDIIKQHSGEVYRLNIGDYSYFGSNWLSIGNSPRSKTINIFKDRLLYVCAYDYGAGYEPDNGLIRLCHYIKPGTRVYAEYFYDAPAVAGKNNIKVYLHNDI